MPAKSHTHRLMLSHEWIRRFMARLHQLRPDLTSDDTMEIASRCTPSRSRSSPNRPRSMPRVSALRLFAINSRAAFYHPFGRGYVDHALNETLCYWAVDQAGSSESRQPAR